MSDQPAVYLPAKIVGQDEDGYIYEAGARRHKRPFVSVEPVGTLTVEVTGDSILNANGRATVVRSLLPPGEYLLVPVGADEEGAPKGP